MKYFTLYGSEMIFFPDKATAMLACHDLGIRFFFEAISPVNSCYWKEDDGVWVKKNEKEMQCDCNFVRQMSDNVRQCQTFFHR